MMKYCLLSALFLSIQLQAQMPCASDWLHQQALLDPGYAQKHQIFEQQVFDFFKTKNAQAEQAGLVQTIPVVVHIIHDNGPENVSNAQVQQAIQWLNQALSNTGIFDQGTGADTEIRLCLAQRDPDGKASNGITRNQSPLTVVADILSNDAALKNLNRWAPKEYLNIWIVRSICTNNSGCGIAAYAYRPIYHGSNSDGIVVEADYFGSNAGNTAVLAHEIGHYFGLYHTFEGGCQNNNCLLDGDRVCDTPPDQSTAAVPCGQTINTCTTDSQSGFNSDQPDMSWNFLDYGLYPCMHDFTAGQAARMQFFLNGTRKSLLASKGCLPPCPAPVTAAFSSSASTVNAGATVTFFNQSQNFGSLQWSLNGTPISTALTTAYQFDTPGIFTIQLLAQATDTLLCGSASTSAVVQVLCPVAAGFTVSNQYPKPGETIFMTNTSQNATQFEWFVNGLSQGSSLDSIVFTQPGENKIYLVAKNSLCSDDQTLLVAVVVDLPCQGYNFIKTYHQTPSAYPQRVSVALGVDGSVYLGSGSLNERTIVKANSLGEIQWAKKIEEQSGEISAISATPDNGLIVLYNKYGTPYKGRIIKISADGQVVWSKSRSQQGLGTWIFNCITPTSDKGFILGGTSRPLLNGTLRAYFLKIDSVGNQQWAKVYWPLDRVSDILQLADGGYLGVGYDGSSYAIRLDSIGNPIWANCYLGPVTTRLLPTADGNFLLTSNADLIFGCNISDQYLIKINPNGELLWTKEYSITGVDQDICFSGITRGNFGGYRAVGAVRQSSTTLSKSFVMQLNEGGFVLNGQTYDIGQMDLQFNDITRGGGGYVLSGTMPNGNAIVMAKMDEAGNIGKECNAEKTVFSVSGTSIIVQPKVPEVAEAPPLQDDQIAFIDVTMADTLRCALLCDTLIFQPEICSNNFDDDGDGLFDCLDPDCDCPENSCHPKQADIWYFGRTSGLDFSTDPPTVLTDGKTNADFASAVANDAQGNLLFYSDGKTVYNRFHQPMPNSLGFPPANSIERRESMILPYPGKPMLFYLFSLRYDINSNVSSANYSLIDMQLDNGRGDLVSGQTLLDLLPAGTVAIPLIAAVRSCIFNGYWLEIKTEAPASAFLSFRIDENGLNTTPVLNPAGPVSSAFGQMKFSPDGLLLAESNQGDKTVTIYNFNTNTGKVDPTPKFVANFLHEPFGLEFSPDGRFLYASIWDQTPMTFHSEVIQFDLQASSGTDLSFSGVQLATLPFTSSGSSLYGAMQSGPDGKIYISSATYFGNFNPKLHVIHYPNRPGAACQFQTDAINLQLTPVLGPGTNGGLCNFPASLFSLPNIHFPGDAPDTICSLNNPVFYQIPALPCYTDSIAWILEGLPGTIESNFQFASVRYTAEGEGRLIVQAFTPCGIAADTLHIVAGDDETPVLDLGPDQTVCDNGVFTFQAGAGFDRYRWQDGATDSVYTTLFPGKYWVDVWDRCGNRQTDTITVSIAPATVLELGPDWQQCPGAVTDFVRPGVFAQWQWLPGNFTSCDTCALVQVAPTSSNIYQVVAQTADGCISVDTLIVTVNDTIFQTLDTVACVGEILDIFGIKFPADTSATVLLSASGAGQCDTLWTVTVFGEQVVTSQIAVSICPGAFFEYQGVLLAPGTSTGFVFPGSNGCDSVVNVQVNAYPALALSLPPDTTLRIGDTIALMPVLDGIGPFVYAWTPTDSLSCLDCPMNLAAPQNDLWVALTVTDANGCQASDSVRLLVDFSCDVFPVTAFTPDGDGNNDWFFPKTDPCVSLVRRWQIFNRWGELVFERRNFPPNQEMLGWNGSNNPSDVYIWLAEINYFNGATAVKKGDVTLLR